MRFHLFAIMGFLAFGHAGIYNKINDNWSFDVYTGLNTDWMAPIADNTPLSSLSIPGSHNSMTYNIRNSLFQTQIAPLIQQLNGGIRYIDITCRYNKRDILAYHGIYETGYTLGYVLETLFDFLDANPRETIVLRIQRGGILDRSNEFIKFFEKYFDTSSGFDGRVADRIYSKGTDGITMIPTLGELRGKVFILQDFETSIPGRYGLPWNKDAVTSYNHKFSVGGLFIKSIWASIKSHLSKAPSAGCKKLRITHTTASVGVSPISLAARSHPGMGMNKYLGQHLLLKEGGCFGIVVMDFPGMFLVQGIINLNDKYLAPRFPDLPTDNTATFEDDVRSA
ncbi:1-phosphatidylinositol phosphodiesterase [Ceratocystis lukuohia]|uniref:1-phosphatidylinositol phosphodiesterase n=1 Tax=Ceratocystis lukuohia TaxID=2019550 RepID=A0ABR4MAB4_9PEZI